MRRFIIRLWRGEFRPAFAFWVAHAGVWLLGMLLFQFLSTSLSMAVKPLVGVPLGLVLVAYNVIAFAGAVRSARKAACPGWLRVMAGLASAALVLLSVWVPLYFLGRPLIVL